MDTLGHRVAHEDHPIAAAVSLVMMALVVVVLDFAIAVPVVGLRGTVYANLAGLVVTALLAVVYARRSHG